MKKKQLISSLFALFAVGVVSAQTVAQPNAEHIIPQDKNLSKEFKQSLYDMTAYKYSGDELKTIGMPCGGIAAGQLYVRGDGSLANWWIANNAYNTGYGIDHLMNFETALGDWDVCYQTFEPMSYVEQYFELTVERKKEKITKRLNKTGFDAIEFTGEYPIAIVDYKDSKGDLPIDVSMEVFSPFIPMDARASATPGTILKFTVKNTSKKKVTVGLNGVLQNMVMRDLKGVAAGENRNTAFSNENLSGVVFDFIPTDSKSEMHPYFGNMTLAVMNQSGVVVDADASSTELDEVSKKGQTKEGNLLNGSVATSVELKAGESAEIVYLLTWYFPNRPRDYGDGGNWNKAIHTAGPVIGNMYANWYASSEDVASYLESNFQCLNDQTQLFHQTWYEETTLPYWLAQRIMMPVSTLATETCQWWATDKFWGWEGVGSCVGTCTHVWNYAQAQAKLFPELERNIREKTDFGTSLQSDGGVQARNGWGSVLIDGHAGAILKLYREHLVSKDNIFLSRHWDKAKRVMEFIIKEDGNEDGLLEGAQSNTYDISFYGANTYVGALYLGALRAAEEMAYLVDDKEAAARYKKIFESGSKLSEEKLWNGQYFVQDVDLTVHEKYQYAEGCLSDQMFGQTWAHMLDLGYLYDEAKVKKTLESVWKYNWATDVEAHNRKYVPERTYADYGEAGLFIATYPISKHLDKDAVRYRNEVWTGIEYQVATNMIYEGMIEEGLAVTRAVHDRYNPSKHNPWNEIECGDHYARALASWGILTALEDYYYDGPKGVLGFSPRITPEDFVGFFTAAEGWGNLKQQITADSQMNSVNVAWGDVRLSKLVVPAAKVKGDVVVKVDGETVQSTVKYDNGMANISFAPQNLTANQVIEVVQE